MNFSSEQVNDQARFAAREFVARWVRDTGEILSAVVTDRMLFAYEMGYLRGHSSSTEVASKMFEEIARVREEVKKGNDDDTDDTDE